MTTQTITIVVNEQGARVVKRNLEEIGDGAEKGAKGVNALKSALSEFTKFFAVGALFAQFTKNTLDLQRQQAQLKAVLRSTGEAAGFSAEQLNRMADAMAANSIFDSGEITEAQTRLLSYTGVVGKNFPAALQAAIDQSARLGISVTQSAEIIGKALENPTKAAEALSRQGFGASFTAAVRQNIKDLVEAGRVGEAQRKILDILNESYKGAAKAARDTLGGALTNLKSKFNDLFRLENTDVLTKAINTVADNLVILAKALGIATAAWATYWIVVNVGAWATLGGRVAGAVTAFLQLAASVRTLAGAMALLQAATLLNPWALLVAAVVAVVAAIFLFRKEIAAALRNIKVFGGTALDIFLKLGDGINGVFQGALAVVEGFVAKARVKLAELAESIPKQLVPDDFDPKAILGSTDEERARVMELAGKSMGENFQKGFQEAQKGGLFDQFSKPPSPTDEPDDPFAGGNNNQPTGLSEEAFDRQKKLLDSIIGPLRDYKLAIADLNALYKSGKISLEQFNEAMADQREKFLNSQTPTTFMEGFTRQMELMRLAGRNGIAQIGADVAKVFGPDGTLINGLADATVRAIAFGESWTGAIKKVAQEVLTTLASAFAKLALKTALGSLSSAGGGFGSIISSVLPFLGFASGGYTGNVGRNRVAGVVHGQEYVMNADATRRNLPLLQAMNSGASWGNAGAGTSRLEVSVRNEIDGAQYEVNQLDEGRVEIIARRILNTEGPQMVAGDIANPNGKTSKAMGKFTSANRRRQ